MPATIAVHPGCLAVMRRGCQDQVADGARLPGGGALRAGPDVVRVAARAPATGPDALPAWPEPPVYTRELKRRRAAR